MTSIPNPSSLPQNKTSSPTSKRFSSPPARSLPLRLFYPLSALLLLILIVSGFHHFYFQGLAYPGRPLTPPIRTLIITHGILMSCWLLLFITQPLLILTRNHKVHMTLGKVGALLALSIFGIGITIAIQSARYSPPGPPITQLTTRPFMAVPIFSATYFLLFVGIAIWKRKKPMVHRPFMLLGTIIAAGAGLSRLDFLMQPIANTKLEYYFGVFLYPCILAITLCTLWCILARKLDKVFIGAAILACGLMVGIMPIARSALWATCTDALLGPAPVQPSTPAPVAPGG